MALLMMEGFETVATVAGLTLRGFSSVSAAGLPQALAARYGARGWTRNGGTNGGGILRRTFPASHATLISGCAMKINDMSLGYLLMRFMDSGTQQIELSSDTLGRLRVDRNGTVLATSTLTLVAATWYYIEMKATIADAGGTVTVKVNGTTYISFTGDTKNTANASVNQVEIAAGNGNTWNVYFDDWYACDTSGSVNNDFLGDVKVEASVATGAGNSTQLTPSAGSNWQNVDETTPNDDTDYNASATVGHKDLYAMSNLVSASGAVKAIQTGAVMRKDDAGARVGKTLIRTGGTNFADADHNLSDSYAVQLAIRETNPDTAAAFTIADVNGLEAGVEVVS